MLPFCRQKTALLWSVCSRNHQDKPGRGKFGVFEAKKPKGIPGGQGSKNGTSQQNHSGKA